MITAVDTNLLLDILLPNPAYQIASMQALDDANRSGAVVMSEPVGAELATVFADRGALDRFIGDTGLRRLPSTTEVLYRAGSAWRDYRRRRSAGLVCPGCGSEQTITCRQCGRSINTRQHVVADFLIGAHALVLADRLLTRDRGYYARYFPDLLLAP